MKNINVIIVAIALSTFVGCRETSTEAPGDTMNGTTPSGDTTSSIDPVDRTDGVVTYKQGDMGDAGVMNQNVSQMYSELEMTDEQIKTYQSSLSNGQPEGGDAAQTESPEQRDKAMKSVLTDVQYDKYEMMKKNASGNENQ